MTLVNECNCDITPRIRVVGFRAETCNSRWLLKRGCKRYYGDSGVPVGAQGKVRLRMQCHLLLRASFLVPLAVCGLRGPACSQTPSAKNPAKTEKKAAEPALTKQQQRGLRLLQSAQAEAVALKPDMRALCAHASCRWIPEGKPKQGRCTPERGLHS